MERVPPPSEPIDIPLPPEDDFDNNIDPSNPKLETLIKLHGLRPNQIFEDEDLQSRYELFYNKAVEIIFIITCKRFNLDIPDPKMFWETTNFVLEEIFETFLGSESFTMLWNVIPRILSSSGAALPEQKTWKDHVATLINAPEEKKMDMVSSFSMREVTEKFKASPLVALLQTIFPASLTMPIIDGLANKNFAEAWDKSDVRVRVDTFLDVAVFTMFVIDLCNDESEFDEKPLFV